MKLRLKATIVKSNQINKTAANPNISPGKTIFHKNRYEYKVIGLSSNREGWILEVPKHNHYDKSRDRYNHLVRQITKKEYFFCQYHKKFSWNNESRYFEFDFDHPLYDDVTSKKEPFVPQAPLPKAKHIFTYLNGTLVRDQNVPNWPRDGEKFVQWIQKLVDKGYVENKKSTYPVNEMVADRFSINPVFNTVEYRENNIPKILKPSATKWKSQLADIQKVYSLWTWSLGSLEGMWFNKMIEKEEFKKARRLIFKKFRATQKMKQIFETLQISEQT